MVHIMTINLAMRTRFVGVKVSGNGLKRIKEILVPMKLATFFNTYPSPHCSTKYDVEAPCFDPAPLVWGNLIKLATRLLN
jgi:hypothetical protein